MIQIGIICPTKFLKDFAAQSHFHLILPHLYKDHPAYVDFYCTAIEKGDYVIQDNSVFELEHSLSAETLVERGLQLGVNEIVAPEVLLDSDASKEVLESFLKRYSSELKRKKVQIMAVAQGKTLTELAHYILYLDDIKEVDVIGIPFDLEHMARNQAENEIAFDFPEISVFTKIFRCTKSLTLMRVLLRWELIDQLAKTRLKLKPFHLMGLSDGIELQRYDYYNRHTDLEIRSNDSSTAFVHGLGGILYTDRGLPCEKIPTKLDFSIDGLNSTQRKAINHNINTLKHFAGHDGY